MWRWEVATCGVRGPCSDVAVAVTRPGRYTHMLCAVAITRSRLAVCCVASRPQRCGRGGRVSARVIPSPVRYMLYRYPANAALSPANAAVQLSRAARSPGARPSPQRTAVDRPRTAGRAPRPIRKSTYLVAAHTHNQTFYGVLGRNVAQPKEVELLGPLSTAPIYPRAEGRSRVRESQTNPRASQTLALAPRPGCSRASSFQTGRASGRACRSWSPCRGQRGS